ncbi:MAG: GNAT family N-acetyltransferase [Rhodospirillales bacterium]
MNAENRVSDENGNIETVVTYLEMRARPTHPTPPAPARKIALLRAENPPVAYYRFLYDAVGGAWMWWERKALADADLEAIIRHPGVEIYVLYVGGVPAGYGELDCRAEGEIELAYFGLTPDFVGQGLGRYFLNWIVDQAWSHEPERVWVHTCNLDHPAALAAYQRAGFEVYDQRTEIISDPSMA